MNSLLVDSTMSWVGRRLPLITHVVSRSDIAKFAFAIGTRDRIHFDPVAAHERGFADCVAPLGYHVTIRLFGPNLIPLGELGSDGVSTAARPPSRASRAMAGATKVRFHRRIIAGDHITVHTSIAGITEKSGRSGPLIVVTYAANYRDRQGLPVVDETHSRILR